MIPRLDHVHAQLDLARDCRGAMIGLVGEARGRARAVAVSAYRAVGRYFPASGASVAQASFRAAELLRAGGEAGAAEAAFRRVAGQACAPVLAARARLEAGHLHRREERALEALAVYGILALDPRTPRRERSLGALWGARVLADAGHLAAAAAVWERVLRRATDPLLRVRASDDWGVSLADAGDFEAAAGVLHLCRLAVAERAAELTELGARVRRALEGMRLVGRLARGVRERHAASTPLLIGRVRIHR
ncbi:MAG: hypothetical protein QGI46_16045 [Planctomycetota bacterium]|nr:hypothetical protein [Planctomycetota bacterium]